MKKKIIAVILNTIIVGRETVTDFIPGVTTGSLREEVAANLPVNVKTWIEPTNTTNINILFPMEKLER